MRKKKKFISYTKERAILSDALPYEVPITFSNRYLYKFLVNNKISLSGNKINFVNQYEGADSQAFLEILKILFDSKTISGHDYINVDRTIDFKKIPFNYKVLHKENDFRQLSIVHPKTQLALVDFYETYKEQVLYYSRISSFSIRKPHGIARFVYYNDKLHQSDQGDKDDFLELSGKEYENLKTFFTYEKYTNIHRFYEDYRYQRAEKKYRILFKIDISKCFDSIYSHSVVWALSNKDIVKERILESIATFGGQFDKLMQHANYGETNGIVIGPEFSRIFAELILQRVDKNVEEKLRKGGVFNRKHYEIYRYVDDYFVFCDDETTKEEIISLFRHQLKEFKMALNDAKAKIYLKPMITEISIAKQKISDLFRDMPIFKIRELPADNMPEDDEHEQITIGDYKFSFYIDSNKLAVKFKTIIKESHIEYKDVLNYTLSILGKKTEQIFKQFDERYAIFTELQLANALSSEELAKKHKLEKKFTEFVLGYLDFIFFLYSVSPRVNSSIKLCNILSRIIKYFKGSHCGQNPRIKEIHKDLVFKKISDDITTILDKNELNEHAQLEMLYLIVVLAELGKKYRMSQLSLAKHFNCLNAEKSISIDKIELNYFSIIALLFYVRDIAQYDTFRMELKNCVKKYILRIDSDKRKKTTESVLLLLDLIVCPYLDYSFKEDILKLYNIDELHIASVIGFARHQKYWFTKWKNFDFEKELNSKKSEEVYS
jgi:hypothetical protein